MKVLPEPVAIWIRQRGRLSASDASRFWMAVTWAGQRPFSSSGGMCCMRLRNVGPRCTYSGAASATLRASAEALCVSLASASQSASVSGLWNANTGRERGVRVEPVREARFHARGFVRERERAAPGGQGVRQAGGVLRGLRLDADERGAAFLGLDDAGGFAVHVEHVVGEAVALLQLELADGDAAVGGDVGLVRVAHDPAGGGQQLVDLVACELFGRGHVTACRGAGCVNISCSGRFFCRLGDSSRQKGGPAADL